MFFRSQVLNWQSALPMQCVFSGLKKGAILLELEDKLLFLFAFVTNLSIILTAMLLKNCFKKKLFEKIFLFKKCVGEIL